MDINDAEVQIMGAGDIIVLIFLLLFIASYIASWIIALRYKREQAQRTPEDIFEMRIRLLQEILDEREARKE